MRRWIRWASCLYPPDWRQRYDTEFAALLEDVEPRWSDFFDVVKGALFMQLKSVWSYRKAALVCGVAGAVIACAISFILNDRYVSYATFRVDRPEEIEAISKDVLSRRSLAALIQSPELDLYKSERRRTPFEDVIEMMRARDLTLVRSSSLKGSTALQIAFRSSNPREAQAVTSALAARVMTSGQNAGLQLLDPASLPQKPIWPNRAAITLLGLLGGFGAGLAVVVVRRRSA